MSAGPKSSQRKETPISPYVSPPKLVLTVVIFIGAMLFGGGYLMSSATVLASTSTGNDVSYPQCGATLPSGQAFGIVGVNDGLANTTNPCLAAEMSWAAGSTGTTSQPKVALYVNTANPGNLGVADWPANDVDPVTGQPDPDPYGTCSGGDDQACAWQYGWNMADLDAQRRGVANPDTYRWWLDVETANSWESNTENNDADLNLAPVHAGICLDPELRRGAAQRYRLAHLTEPPCTYETGSAGSNRTFRRQAGLIGTDLRPGADGQSIPAVDRDDGHGQLRQLPVREVRADPLIDSIWYPVVRDEGDGLGPLQRGPFLVGIKWRLSPGVEHVEALLRLAQSARVFAVHV